MRSAAVTVGYNLTTRGKGGFMDNNIGKRLDGRYELLELIGVGGMADIYRARDTQEDRIVAVKILKTEFAGSDEFLRRFRNESKAIALLSHPNIVKIYDVGFTDKVQFIVMEYVDGITLTDYIEQQGVLKWRDALHFTVQVLKALQHAHDRGIVHRDVKSSNIMLLRDGTIKVMDFGIARFNRENNKTVSEKTIGSVHYISPEQARGDITDERSDIYSVGVALYEMLTGRKPFDGDTPVAIALKHMQSTPKKPSEINETIPEGIEQIVLKAMQKDPAARYQTAGEMINDLEEFKKNPGIVFDYKYNSTDGTAKYADRPNPVAEKEFQRRKRAVQEEESLEESGYYDDEDDDDYYDDDDEYEERRSPLIPILFAVGAAFVIATVFLVLKLVVDAFETPDNSNYSQPNGIVVTDGEFPMPKLIGMSWEEALALYGGDSSPFKLVHQDEWSEIPLHQIFDQDQPEGRRVKVGTTVTVKVSMGIRRIEIQDFTNRSDKAAEQQLRKDGFTVSRTFDHDDDIPKGRVIRTTPAAHEMAEQGSVVYLTVSLGPKNNSLKMPKLTDMKITEAQEICKENHITPIIKEVNSEAEKGMVISQSIDVGVYVDRNTEVELTVSTGEVPEVISTINKALPVGCDGRFEFIYILDGIIDKTEERDVSITAARSIKYDIKGKLGETHKLSIKVRSIESNMEGLYLEVEVDFSKTPPSQEETYQNPNIFFTLPDMGNSSKPNTDSGTSSSTSSSASSSGTSSDTSV